MAQQPASFDLMNQMDFMQRLQMARAQAAMGGMAGRPPYPMPGFGGFPGMPQAPMGKGMDGMGGAGGYNPYTNPFPFESKGKGKFNFNKGKEGKDGFKGKFNKGYGKGKGKFKGGDAEGGEKAEGEGEEEGDRRPPLDARVSPIVNAQREARARFEKNVLDRIQGRWTDESDPLTTYVVEGNICSVSSGDGGRGFRNRLSVYGVEMCWDARRFWHYLNLQELWKAEDNVERLEWNPAKDSPPTQKIVWLKAPDLPKVEEAEAGDGEEGGAAVVEGLVEGGAAVVEGGAAVVEGGAAVVEDGAAVVEGGAAVVEGGAAA